jgi:hypothetical protein
VAPHHHRLEAHDMAVHTTWPEEMLEGIGVKVTAANDDVSGNHG